MSFILGDGVSLSLSAAVRPSVVESLLESFCRRQWVFLSAAVWPSVDESLSAAAVEALTRRLCGPRR